MKKNLLLLVIFSASYFLGFAQTSSQTRTATRFNDYPVTVRFPDFNSAHLVHWQQEGATYLVADDDIYAYSRKLTHSLWNLPLILQGFGFSIPTDATIENITVTVRRFKQGKASMNDYFAYLVSNVYTDYYGLWWRNSEYYPDVETEVTYSESGTGNNGTYPWETYQWTPAMINDPDFGVRIQNNAPEGQGYIVVYYDLVQITVEYTQPVAMAGRSRDASETTPLKEPIVYPNPFTTKANIQFTAAANGKAIVELFNSNGSKIRTLFSDNVVRGQVYNVTTGDAQLPKGIYVYRITNGKQNYKGRLMKVE